MNGRVKLSANHYSKCLIGSKHMSLRLQEIDLGEVGEIINEDHVITVSPF
jgi:hypothetical protein